MQAPTQQQRTQVQLLKQFIEQHPNASRQEKRRWNTYVTRLAYSFKQLKDLTEDQERAIRDAVEGLDRILLEWDTATATSTTNTTSTTSTTTTANATTAAPTVVARQGIHQAYLQNQILSKLVKVITLFQELARDTNMSPSKLEELAKSLCGECAVCMGTFGVDDIQPVVLECFHFLCETCVLHLMERTSSSGEFKCPHCRESNVGYRKSPEEVESAMKKLMDAIKATRFQSVSTSPPSSSSSSPESRPDGKVAIQVDYYRRFIVRNFIKAHPQFSDIKWCNESKAWLFPSLEAADRFNVWSHEQQEEWKEKQEKKRSAPGQQQQQQPREKIQKTCTQTD